MVVIKGLIFVILHKQRRLQRFQQCFLMDIGIRVVYKRTRLDVAPCIDVQIFSAACNAALNIFTVVPEVCGEKGLRFTEFSDLTAHKLTLLGGGHQLRHGICSYRHIGKEPCKLCPFCYYVIKKCFATDNRRITSGVAARYSKGQFFSFQYLHCSGNRFVSAFAAP